MRMAGGWKGSFSPTESKGFAMRERIPHVAEHNSG